MNRWLDSLHQHTSDANTLTNGKLANHTAMRRTMSIANDRPYKITDIEADDVGRSVMQMYSYICPEQPVPRWMCRPTRHREVAFMNECWLDGWAYSTSISRRNAPNWMQAMLYWDLLGSEIRYHRDNVDKSGIALMQEGKDPMLGRKPYAGVQHSQVPGSNVYVWTYAQSGRPMKMRFKVPNVHLGPGQDVSKYIEVECFSIPCCGGYLSILDPLDDILMVHGVIFDDLVIESITCESEQSKSGDENESGFRVAFVMRRLETMHEFYVDTSTIRLDDAMKEAMKKSRAKNNSAVAVSEGRNAYE